MIAGRCSRINAATLYNLAWCADTHAAVYTQPEPGQIDPLYRQSAWIAANREAYKIQAAIHTGDVLTSGSDWAGAATAFRGLSDVMPIMITEGNHDYSNLAVRGMSWYNGSFPLSCQPTIVSTYAGYGNNSWHRIQLGTTWWGIMMLEHGTRTEVLEWAAGILATNSTTPFMIATHSYLCHQYGRYDHTQYDSTQQNYNPHDEFDQYSVPCNDGEEVWQALIRDAGNVGIVICGHDPVSHAYLASARSPTAMFPICHQLLQDYQWERLPTYSGNPYVGLLGIDETNNLLCLQLISPTTLAGERKIAAGLQVPLIQSA